MNKWVVPIGKKSSSQPTNKDITNKPNFLYSYPYEHLTFHAQLNSVEHEKSFITSGPDDQSSTGVVCTGKKSSCFLTLLLV